MKKHIALILAASTLILAGCCTTHQATKWEYKTVHTMKGVNERTAVGWSVNRLLFYPMVPMSIF